MSEPVSLSFIITTIGVILGLTALGVVLVNIKTKKLKKGKN
jgi:hypothetical protein